MKTNSQHNSQVEKETTIQQRIPTSTHRDKAHRHTPEQTNKPFELQRGKRNKLRRG
jgi:hypothetical protein